MSIFVGPETRLVVQGITGRDGSFHTKQMISYGTRVVAGVTPGKGGQLFEGVAPVYDTVAEAIPLAAKGQNRKKALLIVSDGNDIFWGLTPGASALPRIPQAPLRTSFIPGQLCSVA